MYANYQLSSINRVYLYAIKIHIIHCALDIHIYQLMTTPFNALAPSIVYFGFLYRQLTCAESCVVHSFLERSSSLKATARLQSARGFGRPGLHAKKSSLLFSFTSFMKLRTRKIIQAVKYYEV